MSSGGGVQPLWGRNGRELFYDAADGGVMSVPGEAGAASWSSGSPSRVVAAGYFHGGEGTTVRQYDVAADGTRFLVLKQEGRVEDAAPSINVVQNWADELQEMLR